MLLVIEFDLDADMIDVPQSVIDNKDALRRKFVRWMHSKNNHQYRKAYTDKNGKKFYGVEYRSDAFVDWLNRKVLYNANEQATVLKQQVSEYPCDAPSLFF